MAQSGYGRILLFNDFTGEEIYLPAKNHADALGALWNIGGGFTVKGYALSDTVAGISTVEDGLNGQITLSSSDAADGDAMYVTTETCFKPSVNGTMVLETRLETDALTNRRIFAGFRGTMNDDEGAVCTGATGTLTLTAEADLVGFFYDVGLTEAVNWYMVHNGGTTAGETDASEIASGITPVINTMNILRVEVDNNGTARWFIDGVLLKTLAGAVAPTSVFAGCVGALNTGAYAAKVTIDYLAVEANRDWTV